uniref:PHD-type domain-containing protein n=1 Tax=Scleropages formosus TaxID=113540 RepID=A0A8C9SBE6_SCLFO
MQSFRERSCFHGNQHCYQQGPYELSRLENYRHQHSQTRQGSVAKDCYSQPAYPGYGNSSAQAEKQYKGSKISSQHLQSSYGSHAGPAYSSSYMTEGHLQQKWEDSHLPQYEQDMLGRLESHSQSQCPLVTQSSGPVYTSHHQQNLPQDTSPAPMAYTHGQMHFPQHSQSLSTSTPSYAEKCNPTSHCYKNYGMAPNSQYSRHIMNSNSLKQNSYRTQNIYVYQQPPSRPGYEQQAPLQGISNNQENLSKYQHFNQQPQSYCLSELSVRSPEQYYQNCSPSSSHSPARSVGRSPTYSSTPSPLMVSSETFQYSQPPITSGTSSSTNLREQGLHMPQKSHSSPSINHKASSYAGSLKDRFSEKLLSNPSLWSLNALTSQVENISSNVQQLLLSEALMDNKKSSKRSNPKQGENFKDQLNSVDDGLCSENLHTDLVTEAFGTCQTIHNEGGDAGCPITSEGQTDRSYYFCNQSRNPVPTINNCQTSLNAVSSCSLTSSADILEKSDISSVNIPQIGDNCNTLLKNAGEENSGNDSVRSPLSQEQRPAADIANTKDSVKEDYEETSLLEKSPEEVHSDTSKEKLATTCNDQADDTSKQIEWASNEKCPSEDFQRSQVVTTESYPSEFEEQLYHEIEQVYGTGMHSSEASDIKCNRDVNSNSDSNRKSGPLVCKDETLTSKGNNSDLPHLGSGSDPFEANVSAATHENPYEEQQSVLPSQTSEARKEKESLLALEEVINNETLLQPGDLCSSADDQANKSQDEAAKNTMHASSERQSFIRDIAPPIHSAKTAFSVFNEEGTPLSQSRDHIDRRDAAELEPDSPQLPGKSIMHSAPSWADTPPSPKKGDEEIDPEMSCVSAVTPSTKSEPMAPSANLRAINRRHARGRRRQSRILMHTSAGITRISSVERKGVTGAPQEISMPPCKTIVLAEQKPVAQKDLPSQTSTLLAENFPSRMCTRSFTAMATHSLCLHLKRERGPKPSQHFADKDSLDHSESLISKIKWKKQKGPKTAILGHTKGRKGLSEIMHQDENKDTTLFLAPLVKDQKPMVLRSRKQAQENPLKEKGTEKRTVCNLTKAVKDMKKPEEAFLKDQSFVSSKQNLSSADRKSVYRALISNSDEKNEPTVKRKSNCHPIVPIKKQRVMKSSKPDKLQSPLKTNLMRVKASKKRFKRGEHFKLSLNSFLTKDPSPVNLSDVPCLPPQYPAKTKYLPPRKGRGLKYEAMVQKITSPGSKKHNLIVQFENVVENLTKNSTSQATEQIKTEQATEKVSEDSGISQNPMVMQDTAYDKAPEVKKRKGGPEDPPDVVSGTGSLAVSTPRVAKQRAIKNNHEMHLKQRRSRKKSFGQPQSTAGQEPPAATAHTHSPDQQEGSARTSTEPTKCAKGKARLPSTRKTSSKALGKKNSVKQKATSNKRNKRYSDALKPAKNGRRIKIKHRKLSTLSRVKECPKTTLKRTWCKLAKNESVPLFSPYVHIDGTEYFSSICIINRPEEERLLFETRKKTSAKIANPAAVAKAIPSSSAMLQGPLVNKTLNDRHLICCLCGKTANYKELGDLYGPYYPEDNIPRKFLKYKQESAEDKVIMSCSLVNTKPLKKEGIKSSDGGSSGRPRRAWWPSGTGGTARPKFLERYKRLQQFQGCERRVGEGGVPHLRLLDCSGTATERLELVAESREHWVHEDCAIWTSGVFLVAGKLYGVKEAALAAAETSCSACQDVGASISCCWKACPQRFHYCCAKDIGCLLQEDNLSLKCAQHKVKKFVLLLEHNFVACLL